MSIFQLACAALGGVAAAPNVVSIGVDEVASIGYTDTPAGYVFHNNGFISRYVSGVPIVVGTWIVPQNNFSQYEIQATLDSGDTPTSGTIGSWESLSTTRSWTIVNDDTTDSSLITFEIRWTGDNVVQDTVQVTITSTSASAP